MDTVVEEKPLSFATSRMVTMQGPCSEPKNCGVSEYRYSSAPAPLEFRASTGGHYSRDACECQGRASHRILSERFCCWRPQRFAERCRDSKHRQGLCDRAPQTRRRFLRAAKWHCRTEN